jgi:hypothetical protein
MAYVKKFEYSHYDFHDAIHYEIELLKDGAAAGSTSIQKGTGNPTRYLTSRSGRTDNAMVIGSEFKFSFVIDREDLSDYDELFESEYKDWRLDAYRDSTLFWRGYVQPDALKRSLVGNRFIIDVSATDALKDLSNEEFRDDGNLVIGKKHLMYILKTALAPLGIELPFKIQLGTYETTYGSSTSNCLYTTFIYAERFISMESGRTRVKSCLEVLEEAFKDFNVELQQVDGYYYLKAKHEAASYYYQYTWALGAQGRIAADVILGTSDWKVEGDPDLSLVNPLRKVNITHRNRNLGGDVVADLDVWESGSPWSITPWYDEYTEDGGTTLVIPDDDTLYYLAKRDVFELTDDVELTKVTDTDYIRISMSVKIRNLDTDYLSNIEYTIVRIYIDHVTEGSEYLAAYGYLEENRWIQIETNNTSANHITDTGDFNVRVEMEAIVKGGGSLNYSCEVLFRDVHISKITIADEGEIVEDVSYDEFTEVVSALEGREVLEIETLFGDTYQSEDLGAYYVDTAGAENSTYWCRYGKSEAIPLVEIYGLALLTDRQRFKEFISGLNYKDVDDELRPNSVVAINRGDGAGTRYYRVLAYEKSFITNMVKVRLEEMLFDNISYTSTRIILSSVDGQSSGGSTYTVSGGGSFSLLDHNNILGGVHLDTGERAQWDEAYTDRLKWDGGSSELVPATGRASLELGTAALLDGSSISDNEVLVGNGTGSFVGSSTLIWNESALNIYNGSNRIRLNPGSIARIYNYDGSNYIDFYLGDSYALYIKGSNKHVSINTNSDSGYNLNVNGTGYFSSHLFVDGNLDVDGTGNVEGVLTCQNDVGSASFVSGFAGSGWKLDYDTDYTLTVDNLYVRKAMNVYELTINQIRATNGALWVTDAAKIESVTPESDIYICVIDTDSGNIVAPFEADDILRCQKWTGRSVKYYSAQVLSVESDGSAFTLDIIDGTDEPEADDIVVRIGNIASSSDRTGSIYLTSSDDDSPYIDVLDNVTSYDFSGKTKVRLGKLDGIVDSDFDSGDLTGYGLYSSNIFLKGKIIANSGEIGGWEIGEDYIRSGGSGERIILDKANIRIDLYSSGGYLSRIDPNDGISCIYGYFEELSVKDQTVIATDSSYGGYIHIKNAPEGAITEAILKADSGGVLSLRNASGDEQIMFDGAACKAVFTGDSSDTYIHFSETNDFIIGIDYSDSQKLKIQPASAPSTGSGIYYTSQALLSVIAGYGGSILTVSNTHTTSNPSMIINVGCTASDHDILKFNRTYDGDYATIHFAYGTYSLSNPSDIRKKKLIENISGESSLNLLNKINPINFLWKKDHNNPKNGNKLIGYIAQELKKIIPEMVHHNTSIDEETGEKHDDYFINQSYIIPYLHAAIKQLYNLIKEIQK